MNPMIFISSLYLWIGPLKIFFLYQYKNHCIYLWKIISTTYHTFFNEVFLVECLRAKHFKINQWYKKKNFSFLLQNSYHFCLVFRLWSLILFSNQIRIYQITSVSSPLSIIQILAIKWVFGIISQWAYESNILLCSSFLRKILTICVIDGI